MGPRHIYPRVKWCMHAKFGVSRHKSLNFSGKDIFLKYLISTMLFLEVGALPLLLQGGIDLGLCEGGGGRVSRKN